MALVPSLRGHNAPLHPLIVWCAAPYGLSMLARYRPAECSGHIDVDESANAGAVERLLRRAMEDMPRLIDYAIVDVA
jgi:hypothetical protein